ncbi:MAG: exopolyphosphatase [Flaviflexus sp.]|nr:exopolyphosphatase [Flaviflexus sp.]
MRVAGIDCGTNSLRLLIADIDGGQVRDVVRRMEVARLGEGVDRTGEFSAEALARTFAITDDYAEELKRHGVERVRFAATSASRDVSNRDEFTRGITDRIGQEPQVISGLAEAQLSFLGALSAVSVEPDELVAVVDLGGGSTEIVVGSARSGAVGEHSMNVGCVRMQERHLHDDPPTPDQIEAARRDVRAALDEAQRVPLGRATRLIGLAGTVTTVTARALHLPAYDPRAIDATFLTVDEIDAACDFFLTANREQRAAEGYLHPGRVDVIAAGALVWQEVVHRAAELIPSLEGATTSEHDILDGLALWAAGELDIGPELLRD